MPIGSGYGGGLVPAPYNQGPFPSAQPYQRYTPYQGLPGDAITQLVLQGILNQVVGTSGGVPMGMSGGLMNNIRAQNFTFTHDQIANWGYQQTVQGPLSDMFKSTFFRAANIDPNDPVSQRRYDNFAHAAQPAVTAMLNTDMGMQALDTLSGGRNPWSIAHQVHMAGKNWTDPLTGVTGYGVEASTGVAQALHDRFGFGGTDWRVQTRGLTASQIGGAVRDLGLRGIVGEDDVSSAGDGKIDVARLTRKIEDYTKDVAAMNEIFGASGRHNAPFKRLREAVETFTMGANYHIDPGRTEMLIRNTYQAAQNAGVGMEGLFQLLQSGGAHAQQLGLTSPGFWANMSVTDSLSYAAGMDRASFMTPSWGAMDPTQLMAFRGQLNRANVASASGNYLGMLARAQQTGLLDPTSEAAGIFAQARAGVFDERLLDNNQMLSLISSGTGLSMSQVYNMEGQRAWNEEAASKFDFGAALRAGNKAEFFNDMSEEAIGNLVSTGRTAGLTGDRLTRMTNLLRRTALDKIGGMAKSEAGLREYADFDLRSQAVGQAFVSRLRRDAAGTGPEAADARRMLASFRNSRAASGLTGEAAEVAGAAAEAGLFLGGVDEAGKSVGAMSVDILRESYEKFAASERTKTGIEAEVGRAMAGKHPEDSLMMRLMQAAQTGKYEEGAGFTAVASHLLKAVGGIAELKDTDPRISSLAERMRSYADVSKRFSASIAEKKQAILKSDLTGDARTGAIEALIREEDAFLEARKKEDKSLRDWAKRTEGGEEFLEKLKGETAAGGAAESTFSGSLIIHTDKLMIDTEDRGRASGRGDTVEAPGGGDSVSSKGVR